MKANGPFSLLVFTGHPNRRGGAIVCWCCEELAPVTSDRELGETLCRPCAIQMRHAGRVLRAAGFSGVGPDPLLSQRGGAR